MAMRVVNTPLELVNRAREGDREAFGKLYELHYPNVYSFLMFRVRHPQLAEDLAATAFMRLLARVDKLAPDSNFGALLMVTARNLVIDYIQSARFRREWTVGDYGGVHDTAAAPGADEEYLATITDPRLRAALESLTPDQLQVMILYGLHGNTDAETARQVGKNASAVKSLVYRARHRAIAHLRESGYART